ncbi:MAG: lysozyme [Gammaproteobacteria bacterium]|nr:MAG: lysozyme [Gammaproteobacteria bacterium]
MKTSAQGVDLLIRREGLRRKWYFDSKHLPTIGVGHLITATEHLSGHIKIAGVKVKWRKGLTFDQVTLLFKQDLLKFEKTINTHVKIKLKPHQFDALVSFSYNIGRSAFFRSTLLRRLNLGRFAAAADEFKRWRRPAGIISRRAGELAQFKGTLFTARIEGGFDHA